jgi:hypothetical protein
MCEWKPQHDSDLARVGDGGDSMRNSQALLYLSLKERSSPLSSPCVYADDPGFEWPVKSPKENPRSSAQSAEKKLPIYCPVPVSFITAGLSGALLLTVPAPLIDPFTLGVNVTLNEQVAPAATVAPQGVPPDGVAE